MQLFEVKYDKPEDGDLYAISIVESPANGFQFVAMSSDKKETIKMADTKKKILCGVVLVPDQLIYREFEDGTPFNLKFSSDTIEKLSQDFLRKGYQLNSTFDHKGSYLNGIAVVESWIVEDPNNDKANALGFSNLPKGTWMASMKLSDELWSQYVETGLVKGFSIDSFLDLQKVSMSKINNNKINKKEKMSLLKKLIKMFSEGVQLETITIDGMGDLTADAFEVGNIVYQDVEGVMTPLASQSFEYDGFTYVTDETGAIVSKDAIVAPADAASGTTAPMDVNAPVMASEDVTVEVGEDCVEDSPATETAAAMEDIAEEVADGVVGQIEEVDVEALRQMIADLQAKLEIITKEKETITSENVAMKEQLSSIPNASKLRTNKENSTSVKMTEMDSLRAILAKAQK